MCTISFMFFMNYITINPDNLKVNQFIEAIKLFIEVNKLIRKVEPNYCQNKINVSKNNAKKVMRNDQVTNEPKCHKNKTNSFISSNNTTDQTQMAEEFNNQFPNTRNMLSE